MTEPAGVKVSETSVASAGSKKRCQVKASRCGGSQARTSPHVCSAPSGPVSTIRPPTYGSNASASGPPETVFADGHQVASRSVQTVNACAGDAATSNSRVERVRHESEVFSASSVNRAAASPHTARK